MNTNRAGVDPEELMIFPKKLLRYIFMELKPL